MTAGLLTRGTSRLNATRLAELLERRATMSSFSGRNTTATASGMNEDFPLMMNTLAECLLDSQFPEDELEKQRTLQLAAIRQSMEQPMNHARDAIQTTFFPGHPSSFSTLGDSNIVASLQRDDVHAFHKKLLSASNLVVSVFGDITLEEAIARVGQPLAALPNQAGPTQPPLPPAPRQPQRVEQALPFKQTVLIRAWPGIVSGDPRDDALTVLMDALSGLSSDLFIEVRDKRGLAYFTGATRFAGPVGGLFMIYAGTTEEGRAEVEKQSGASGSASQRRLARGRDSPAPSSNC